MVSFMHTRLHDDVGMWWIWVTQRYRTMGADWMSNVSLFPFKSRLYCIVELVEWWERKSESSSIWRWCILCIKRWMYGCGTCATSTSIEWKKKIEMLIHTRTHARILVDTLNVHRFTPFKRSIKNVHSNSPVSIKICGFLLMILLPTIYSHNIVQWSKNNLDFIFIWSMILLYFYGSLTICMKPNIHFGYLN